MLIENPKAQHMWQNTNLKFALLFTVCIGFFIACVKVDQLPPVENTVIEVDTLQQIEIELLNPNAYIHINKFVIHQMDFINHGSYDGSSGPDLYFIGMDSIIWEPSLSVVYDVTPTIYNVTPSMLPLTIDANISTVLLKELRCYKLVDYDTDDKFYVDEQDLMMYDGYDDANTVGFDNPFIQFSGQKNDGSSYFITCYDTGSNLKYSVYYTYE